VKTGISVKIEHPSSLGADRLVDAAGAYYTYGGPCIVIDFGTATTYDVVSEKGEFLGGATSAGIGITANALSSMAAQLPEIEISTPDSVIGKSTVKSMQAGIVFGYIGQVEYIVKKIKEEYGENLKVISTGGLGKILYHQTSCIDVYDRELTFKGLKIIYDKNKKKIKNPA
jgi:type III pantothenate kinase